MQTAHSIHAHNRGRNSAAVQTTELLMQVPHAAAPHPAAGVCAWLCCNVCQWCTQLDQPHVGTQIAASAHRVPALLGAAVLQSAAHLLAMHAAKGCMRAVNASNAHLMRGLNTTRRGSQPRRAAPACCCCCSCWSSRAHLLATATVRCAPVTCTYARVRAGPPCRLHTQACRARLHCSMQALLPIRQLLSIQMRQLPSRHHWASSLAAQLAGRSVAHRLAAAHRAIAATAAMPSPPAGPSSTTSRTTASASWKPVSTSRHGLLPCSALSCSVDSAFRHACSSTQAGQQRSVMQHGTELAQQLDAHHRRHDAVMRLLTLTCSSGASSWTSS